MTEPRINMRRYYLGIAAVGFTMGIFAGLSSSPVVAVLLPLLFGLLGGAGGLYLGIANLADDSTPWRFRAIGTALLALTIPLTIAAMYASVVRTGSPWSSFLLVRRQASAEMPSLRGMSADAALELLLLRRKLDMLGVKPDEQKLVLETASQDLQGTRTRPLLVAACQQVVAAARKALVQLEPTLEELGGDPSQAALEDIARMLRGMASEYSYYAQKIADGGWLPVSAIGARLEVDRDRLIAALHNEDATSALAKREPLRNALWDVQVLLIEEAAKTTMGWRADSRLAEALNEFFKSSAGKGSDAAAAPAQLTPAFAH
jgi:hypothetical protein